MIDTVYYQVSGSTPWEWMAAAPAAAAAAGIPASFQALTISAPRSTYVLRNSEFGCEARNAAVVLGISFVMPRLASDNGVSAENMTEWRRRMQSLWTHEGGHATRAMRAAAELRDSLRVLHDPECGLLRSRLFVAQQRVTEKYRLLQADYDARTQHGLRQGAMIIPFRGVRLAVDTTFRDTVP
ncbi:MAG: DUF922 domain-containing Zn-dependent protease [Gemmatimonadota bacterium]|nr:DUF922 domain-containing Zn-dependent protease [Gemmatimonadota bacterium]